MAPSSWLALSAHWMLRGVASTAGRQAWPPPRAERRTASGQSPSLPSLRLLGRQRGLSLRPLGQLPRWHLRGPAARGLPALRCSLGGRGRVGLGTPGSGVQRRAPRPAAGHRSSAVSCGWAQPPAGCCSLEVRSLPSGILSLPSRPSTAPGTGEAWPWSARIGTFSLPSRPETRLLASAVRPSPGQGLLLGAPGLDLDVILRDPSS